MDTRRIYNPATIQIIAKLISKYKYIIYILGFAIGGIKMW